MEARLPDKKLEKCCTMLLDFYKPRKVTLHELQSLIGLLNFTCSVVLPGRAFLRRLIDLTRGIQRPNFKIRLNKDAKSDLIVWLLFLEQYNGRTFFLDERMSASRYEITSDAAGSKGYGALFKTHWFYGSWPEFWQLLNIAALELFPLVIALHIWGDQLADKCVTFVTDNAALVDIISKQTSKHKIQYCAKVMQTKFVAIRPLFSRLFYEKSSNFRKMFRRVPSEKITIFLENSRERNSK